MNSRSLACIILLPLFTSVPSEASNKGIQSSGLYLTLGGGADFQIAGLDDGFYPAVEAGIGYYHNYMEIEIDLFWNRTDWDSDVPITDETFMPLIGGAEYSGNGFGAIVYANYFPKGKSPRWNYFITLGFGAEFILTEVSMGPGIRTPCEESFTMGGVLLRVGNGTEFMVNDWLSMELAVMYTFANIFHGIECHESIGVPKGIHDIDVHSIDVIASMKFSI
jgi:hypothetical protein